MKRVLLCLLCLTLLASVYLYLAGREAPSSGNAASEAESVGSPAPDITPKPAETAKPESTPKPAETTKPESTPKPVETTEPVSTSEPAEKAVSVEPLSSADTEHIALSSFSCQHFVASIPDGWEVNYEVFDAGGGVNRIVINIYDPLDPNCMIFYASAMEPFFTSLDAKNAYLPYLDTCYEWSPILSEPSAEETLGQWAAMFTLMQAEGLGLDDYFRNYLLQDVLATAVADDSTDEFTRSGALATVSIPAADSRYVIYFENSLVLQPPTIGLPIDARYYISFDNCGVVLREDLYQTLYSQLIDCMRSINLYAFAGQHDIIGSEGRLTVAMPIGVPVY